ncbi:hypothetical protein N656DRAFT_799608 [Canariomyces notabilis]|uniref:DUF6594 domain-containing protein n=1 Tax=Canariomyces notabilis TaxID=2074819 RepID=A0AAN6QJ21_9PEZI|nr:hypothetical protein N656DRAFT_799608 [Canariomyces arenarius]
MLRHIIHFWRSITNPAAGTGWGNSAESELEKGKRKNGTVETKQPAVKPFKLQDQLRSIGGDDVGRLAVLSFRTLQLYRIAALQKKLVEIQMGLVKDGKEPPPDTDTIIQNYADAIRNYETLTQEDIASGKIQSYDFLGGEGTEDDFRVVKRENLGSGRMGIWHPASLTVEARHKQLNEIGRLGFRELDRKRRLERDRMSRYALRLRMAVFGGLAVISPMLIMALVPGLVVSLVTTSVATAIFGAVMVIIGTDSSGKDVLASTAAYAAFLVVFIGTHT